MKRLAALFVAVLFALSLTGLASAGEPKKDEPAVKEATTMEKDNTVKVERKPEKRGKRTTPSRRSRRRSLPAVNTPRGILPGFGRGT